MSITPISVNGFTPFVREDKLGQTKEIHYINPAAISDIYQTKTEEIDVQKLTLRSLNGASEDIFVKAKPNEVYSRLTGAPMSEKKYLSLADEN